MSNREPIPEEEEAPMTDMNIQSTPKHLASDELATVRCNHSRMVDDVLTKSKKNTGKVRCLECSAIVDDPYRGPK
jgi:hypothetical protein